MGPLIDPITNRRSSVTKRRRQPPLDDKNGNLTPLDFQVLQWVEARRSGDRRSQIEGLSAFSLDTVVAELVLRDLIKAVSMPQRRFNRARLEPTGLTAAGWRTLMKHRRTKPQPLAHPSFSRLQVWG
jgi:hypothetical protein